MPGARRRLTASGAGLGCIRAVCLVTAATAAFGGESVSIVIKAVPSRVRDEDTDCLTDVPLGEKAASPTDGRSPCFWSIYFLFCVCCVWGPVQDSVSIMTAASLQPRACPPARSRGGDPAPPGRALGCPWSRTAGGPPCAVPALPGGRVHCGNSGLLLVCRVCRRGSGEASP